MDISDIIPPLDYTILISGLSAFLFWFKNPDRTFINELTFLLIAIFWINFITIPINHIAITYLGLIAGVAFSIFYLLRYGEKQTKRTIDHIKLIGAILIGLNNFFWYDFLFLLESQFALSLLNLVVPINGTIYIYDRWILKPKNMKTKFVIVLVGQTLLILVFIVFAFFQKTRADEEQLRALENVTILSELQRRLERLRDENEKTIEKLERKVDSISTELKNCQTD